MGSLAAGDEISIETVCACLCGIGMAPAPAGHQHPGHLGSTEFCSSHWSLVREDKAGIFTCLAPHAHMRIAPLAFTIQTALATLLQHAYEHVRPWWPSKVRL